MKLQCSCGAKYAFDLTPEMAQNPVKFVCPACGLDSSDYVNHLVREELAQSNLPAAPAPALAPEPPPAARLKISREEKPAEPVPDLPISSKFCSKHRERATEKCAVCGKPICPKCLELLGYFCSPLCQGKAEAQNLDVPLFAGRKDLVEAKFWRRTGLVIGVLATMLVLALGAWTWYAWFGSVPHPVFSVRFDDSSRAYAGASQLVGQDQLVFLHGGTLARCDLKTRQQIWSQELVSPLQIDALVKAESDVEAQMAQENAGSYFHRRSGADIETSVKQRLQARLSLHVSGDNIWVGKGELLTHYDWDTGKVLREVVLSERGELQARGDELLAVGAQSVTHVNLASGDSRVETLGATGAASFAPGPNSPVLGLPGTTADNGRPLDPQKVEAQAQNLNLPGRIALPALLGNATHEQQLEAALKDDPQHPRPPNRAAPSTGAGGSRLVPGPDGFVQFSTRLLEEHLVTRSAMQAPPAKSVLNGDLNAAQTTTAANEILNEMQRNRGGDTVTEDESRYQVAVHLPGDAGPADWTGEVIGPPQLFVLKTVNVVAAGKSVIVLDQANKKLWSAELTYNVAAAGGVPGESSQFGAGPCVEHGDTLYVFDQAVLSAFDLSTGNARWRLPSVGVIGLFFDGQDNLYVNTTTGNPDDIKYSRQIDLARKTEAVLFKLDPKTGKTLWSIKPGGYVSYLSGKYIYTVESYDPNPADVEETSDMMAALQKPAYLSIKRIRPSDGRVLWEHAEDRCPVAVRFDENSLELIFKKEVQVLRYLAF